MKHFSPTTLPLPNGVLIDFLDPRVEDIDFGFIARRLGSIRRFTGNARALTVDTHSWLVTKAMQVDGHQPALQLIGLLHDAHEAYTGDLTSPFRRALTELAGRDVVTAIQDRLDMVIFKAAGIKPATYLDPKVELTVREYDLRARVNEIRDFMGEDPAEWNCNGEALPVAADVVSFVNNLHPYERAEFFLGRLSYLQGQLENPVER